MKKIISTLSFLLLFATLSFAQEDKAYKETLQTMFKLSGSEETYQVAITQMFTMFKQQYTNVDVKTWTELEAEFKKTSMTDLVELLVPIYKKHLTIDDVKELIKFYETPIGKKFATKTPLIMQGSMEVGQQWGMKIGEELAKKMKQKGY